MVDKNECNISEYAIKSLDEKYGKDNWSLEAVKFFGCNNCVFTEICNYGNMIFSNNCGGCSRNDKQYVHYTLKKQKSKPKILTPDFSLAEVGDVVQGYDGLVGKVDVKSSDYVCIIVECPVIGKKNYKISLEGYDYTSKYPLFFFGTFDQFPTIENCTPKRDTKTKLTVDEIEAKLGYKIEIVSEK